MILARLWIVFGALFVAMASSTANAPWLGDFWEHAAVVRELAAEPWHPHHPVFDLNVPHAFFSPYALFLGLVARLAGAGAVPTLAAGGLVNLVLVLTGLRRLAGRVFSDGDRVAFWALLFMLFLWSGTAWMWSGFLSFRALAVGSVLPYPSTFAAALSLHALAWYLAALDEDRPWLHAPVALASAVVLVCHPTTAVALFAGLGACFVARVRDRIILRGALLIAVVGIAAGFAVAWPYFSLIDLLRTQSAEFHQLSQGLYVDVWGRLWPSLVAAPAVLWRLRESRRDVLVVWLGLLLLVYAFGFFSGSSGIGRSIAFIALVLQLGAAGLVARAEVSLPRRWRHVVVAATVAVVLALAVRNGDAFSRCWPQRTSNTFQLAFLRDFVGPHDVVLSDLYTSWKVPAFAGRIVASLHPVYWVPNHDDRRRDLRRFFDRGVSDVERHQILQRWNARFLLIDRRRLKRGENQSAALSSLGRVVKISGTFILVDVAP